MTTINDGRGLETPRDFVQSGWEWVQTKGGDFITLSQQAVGDLSAFRLTPIQFDATLDLNVDYGTFVRPVAPVVPDLGTVDVPLPTAPTITPVSVRELGDAPAEPDFANLVYAPPAAPAVPMPTLPSDLNPVLDVVTVPDAPTFALPAHPTLYALNLPEPPSITLPEFAGTRPTFDITPPDSAFNWQEVAYSSTLLDAVKSHLQSMIQGGLGLPPHIEQAIFDRGRERGDLLARKRVQEVAEELGSRGLYEPSGLLARRLDEAREAGRAEAAGTNRDVTIRATEIEVESVQFALTQAGALEATLIQQNGAINQRALEAAKIGSDIQVAVFNAAVTLANLDVELFKADAQVYRDLIQARIAQVDVYKAQIDGQKAIGEINESLVRAYVEEVRSINAMADVYRAQVEGARAKAELNTQKLEQARLKVQAYGEEVRAWGGLQEVYRIQMDGALGNVRMFEAIGNIYGRRVEAYRTKGDAYLQQGQFQIAQQALQWDGYKAALDGARTLLAAQTATIDARARTFAARAGMYQAEAQVAETEAQAFDRQVQLRIEAARARQESALKGVELQIVQADKIGTLYVEQLKTRAQVLTQMSASLFSGINFGANYSGSLGWSYGKSASWGYTGDAPDYTGIAPNGNF